MQRLARLTWVSVFVVVVVFSAPAEFSSLYVFGDGACTTTNGPGVAPYYGKRYTNGRVWVEVLAQWQGITYESNKNWSYYGHYSSNMLQHVVSSSFPDAGNALFVVWACDADLVYNVNNYGTSVSQWTNTINAYLSNHFAIVSNLYAKGARTLVMPNAVDLGKVPRFNNGVNKAFIRQQTTNFNARFAGVLSNAAAAFPDLKIYAPDIFSLLDDVVANSAKYGMIKSATNAIGDLPPSQWALNGPGTNYVYWDDLDPTAMFHMWIADAAQRIVSPVSFEGIVSLGDSNRLDVVNVPVGRHGFVEGSASLVSWATVLSVNTNSATQSIFVPATAPSEFYRLRFPFAWSWP